MAKAGVRAQECLQAEVAPLALWLDFVKAFLAAGQLDRAEDLLREGTSDEVCAPPRPPTDAPLPGGMCAFRGVQPTLTRSSIHPGDPLLHENRGQRAAVRLAFKRCTGLERPE